jgi:hypothetical protein
MSTPGESGDSEVDVDAAWAQIIANWDEEADVRRPPEDCGGGERGALDDLAAEAAVAEPVDLGWDEIAMLTRQLREQADDDLDAAEVHPVGWAPHRSAGPRDADPTGPSLLDDLDEDDHYEPPEPPPLPRPGLIGALGWLGAVGAPLFLLIAALFWRSVPAIIVGLSVISFIAGFVTLVMRMPDRHDGDDDGAVV